MSDEKDPAGQSTGLGLASRALDSLKLDFNTIRTILLSALVVCALMLLPLFFILKNFVTFDSLDKYLRLTDSVRPKILTTISEEIGTGYSKNFIIDPTRPVDNTMLFYATQKQRVTLSVSAIPVSGDPQPVSLQLNGCSIRDPSQEPLHLYEFDLTKKMEDCGPDEPNLHTLKVVFPQTAPKGSVYQIKCLIVVYERVHAHVGEK